MAKKLMSFDVNNEQVILASMIKSKVVRRQLSSELKEYYFVGSRHRIIFKTLCEMVNLKNFNEDTFDVLAKGQDYGGFEYLRDVQKCFDVNDNIEIHAKKLIKDSVRVSIKKRVLPDLEDVLDDPAMEIDDLQGLFHRAENIIKNGFTDDMVMKGNDLKLKYTTELKDRSTGVKEVIGTGFPEIDDEITEGFQGGKVVTITARPSMGKTTFASNLIRYWTEDLKLNVLACPLETGSNNLMDYLVVQKMNKRKSKLNLNEILKYMKNVDLAKKHKINKAIDEIGLSTLSVADSRKLTLSKLKVILQNGDYDICVVDLFSKLADVNDMNINEKLEEVQVIAQDTGVCMVIVSQLRRFGKGVLEKKPDLEQIKNSGLYEEISDLVIGLYREHYYNRDAEDILEVIVMKQRNGKRNFSNTYEFLGDIATIGEYKEPTDGGGW
jgi:replicative DNA helicase